MFEREKGARRYARGRVVLILILIIFDTAARLGSRKGDKQFRVSRDERREDLPPCLVDLETFPRGILVSSLGAGGSSILHHQRAQGSFEGGVDPRLATGSCRLLVGNLAKKTKEGV